MAQRPSLAGATALALAISVALPPAVPGPRLDLGHARRDVTRPEHSQSGEVQAEAMPETYLLSTRAAVQGWQKIGTVFFFLGEQNPPRHGTAPR